MQLRFNAVTLMLALNPETMCPHLHQPLPNNSSSSSHREGLGHLLNSREAIRMVRPQFIKDQMKLRVRLPNLSCHSRLQLQRLHQEPDKCLLSIQSSKIYHGCSFMMNPPQLILASPNPRQIMLQAQ